jgi:hypothetical protein
MKFWTALALAGAALAIGMPAAAAAAAADPDGYQPQLRVGAQPAPFDRYNLAEEQSDMSVRATGAASHPDSRADRSWPGVGDQAPAVDRDWSTAALGALGGALVMLLAIVGASAIRERRRLVLH